VAPIFRTRKDGTVYPITPKKKKKTAAGTVVAAAVLAGLMAAANGGDATASVGAALDAAVSQHAAADPDPVDAETSSGEQAARRGDEKQAWQRLALKEIKKEVETRLRCPVQSYGQVRDYFLRTPCDSLRETLFALVDARGDITVVTVAWVRMSSEDDASGLKAVEDTYGTGDVTPFATEVLELGRFRLTGRHYASRQDGSLVVVSEAEPLRGHPSATVLADAPKVAAALPPP
jgi:hypothetical protein